MCRELQIAPQTYYAARSRPTSNMAIRHATMKPKIQETWEANYKVYGIHKIWKQLGRQDEPLGRDQVAHLMKELGIEGIRRGKKRRTTVADPSAARAPDLVDRNFTATRPNQLWVADFTYVATWSGMVYVAFVIDVFSRMIVGWRVSTSMTTDLVLDTLEMAIWRRDDIVDGVICHSDAGSQGEIKWSSQHLDSGGGRWRQCGNVSGRSSFIEGRSHHRDGPRWPGVKIGSDSGRRSVAA